MSTDTLIPPGRDPATRLPGREERAPGLDSLEAYRAALGRYPLVPREQELALARRMHRGCRQLLLLLASEATTRRDLVAALRPGLYQAQPFRSNIQRDTLERLAALPATAPHAQRLRLRRAARAWLQPVRVNRQLVLQVTARALAHPGHPDADRLQRCWHVVQTAREQLIQANLRLVVHIAGSFARPAREVADLIQEGNLGLIKAVDLFDAERGCRFSTYAYPWIRVSIQNGLMDRGDCVRMPHNVHEQLSHLRRSRSAYQQRHGRSPGATTLATASGMPVERVRRLLQLGHTPVSASRPLYAERDDDGGEWLPDQGNPGPVEVIHDGEARSHLRHLLAQLEPRRRRIVILRNGLDGVDPMTCSQVGEVLGLSRERVRQLEIEAMAELRDLAPALYPDRMALDP